MAIVIPAPIPTSSVSAAVGDAVDRILIALCGGGAAGDRDGILLGQQLRDDVVRARLLESARDHGVLGLTLAALDRSVLPQELPVAARRLLYDQLAALRRRAALWVLERDRVLMALHAAGFDPVVLKGGALCTLLYSEPVEREFGDLDLLLPRHQTDEAAEVLLAAGYRNPWNEAQLRGYRQHHYHLRLLRPPGFVVELHWGLTKPGAPFALFADEFLEHARRATSAGCASARVPRPEHLLLHVVSQNAQDHFPRMVRLVDLDRLVRAYPSMDWDRLARTAEQGGLGHPLGLSLQLARRILGTPVPRDVLSRVRPGRIVQLHLGLLRPARSLLDRRFVKTPEAGRLLTLWLMADMRLRLRYLVRLVTGSHDPLAWIWRRAEAPSRAGNTLAAGLASVGMLAAYQCGLYVRGIAASLTASGRSQMRL